MSHETISNTTDVVLEEVKAWQSRPLEAVYRIPVSDSEREEADDRQLITRAMPREPGTLA